MSPLPRSTAWRGSALALLPDQGGPARTRQMVHSFLSRQINTPRPTWAPRWSITCAILAHVDKSNRALRWTVAGNLLASLWGIPAVSIVNSDLRYREASGEDASHSLFNISGGAHTCLAKYSVAIFSLFNCLRELKLPSVMRIPGWTAILSWVKPVFRLVYDLGCLMIDCIGAVVVRLNDFFSCGFLNLDGLVSAMRSLSRHPCLAALRKDGLNIEALLTDYG